MDVRVINMVGEHIGRLTIISFNSADKGGNALWNCLCNCGNKVIVSRGNLKKRQQSCGCYLSDMFTKHGKSTTAEYGIWKAMINRCLSKNNIGYKYYGGRGIKVCKRWMNFNNFLSDMGERPKTNLTLERRNNDEGYSPDNCYWAT